LTDQPAELGLDRAPRGHGLWMRVQRQPSPPRRVREPITRGPGGTRARSANISAAIWPPSGLAGVLTQSATKSERGVAKMFFDLAQSVYDAASEQPTSLRILRPSPSSRVVRDET